MSTATVTPIRRTVRVATFARWQKALARAVEQGLSIRLEASTGMAIVTSGTDDTLCYVTDGQTCSCQAGANGDPVCKHRALYWSFQGMLDPDPPTGAPAVLAPARAAYRQCPSCGAKHGRRQSCAACAATGMVAVAA